MVVGIVFILLLSPVLAAVPLPFAVITGNEAVATREVWLMILEDISERSGHDMKLQLNHDHSSIKEGFRSGESVFAVVDPLRMMQMRQENIAQPLLEVTGPDGSGVKTRLYVRKDSVIREVEDLIGHTIAILPPDIHCAANEYPMEMIASILEIKLEEVFLLDTSESIVKAIRYGAVDAGIITEIIPGQDVGTVDLRLIVESEPVAFWYVVVRPDYSSNVITAIKDALLSFNGVYHFILPEQNDKP
ncbi:MAG: hypothetical protein DRP70_03575 [Spirochaetes bacterium]|nr:MAG: hypothetical protein DRP49_08410 [Spirochaetota bacterium]RKX89501.1 MAG: hypothetical protein DRP70_03575 [Spirochaetota bacterium]RKX98047.1 MAG: hypothetical protein DRZ90_04200 [Spirochaetota bacterium]